MSIKIENSDNGLVTLRITGKGIRRFPIEIFAPSEFSKALAWATEP